MAQKQTRCWYAQVVHATVDHIGFDVAFYSVEIQKITDNVYKYADFVLIKMFPSGLSENSEKNCRNA
jgi:hypothetical protein